jgi:hypothetical protein
MPNGQGQVYLVNGNMIPIDMAGKQPPKGAPEKQPSTDPLSPDYKPDRIAGYAVWKNWPKCPRRRDG